MMHIENLYEFKKADERCEWFHIQQSTGVIFKELHYLLRIRTDRKKKKNSNLLGSVISCM